MYGVEIFKVENEAQADPDPSYLGLRDRWLTMEPPSLSRSPHRLVVGAIYFSIFVLSLLLFNVVVCLNSPVRPELLNVANVFCRSTSSTRDGCTTSILVWQDGFGVDFSIFSLYFPSGYWFNSVRTFAMQKSPIQGIITIFLVKRTHLSSVITFHGVTSIWFILSRKERVC